MNIGDSGKHIMRNYCCSLHGVVWVYFSAIYQNLYFSLLSHIKIGENFFPPIIYNKILCYYTTFTQSHNPKHTLLHLEIHDTDVHLTVFS